MREGRVITALIAKQIEGFVETMKSPTAGKISRRLGLKHGTVYWFMLSRGLISKKPARYRQKPYVRNGLTINPYSAEQDVFILAMRTAGATFDVIAKAATEEFGSLRNAHSVHNRIVMLEAVDDDCIAT